MDVFIKLTSHKLWLKKSLIIKKLYYNIQTLQIITLKILTKGKPSNIINKIIKVNKINKKNKIMKF